MNNKNKIVIGLVSALVLTSLILIVVFVVYPRHHLKKELSNMVVNYYEDEFKDLMPNFLKRNGSVVVDLEDLRGLGKDISLFEKHSCNFEGTSVTLTYNEKSKSSYDINVTLDCGK